MSRKLMCEINPFFYHISVARQRLKRTIYNAFHSATLAKEHQEELLPYIIKGHTSIVLRKLHNVDNQLQINKETNLILASKKISHLIIHPGETFSFWYTVGKATKKLGYKEGLTIGKNGLFSDIGGGLCQEANMIHYLVLNSPLEVTELHHHSDALFPDERRRVPFGTGTSIFYNYLDYQFKNTTENDMQLVLWVEDHILYGELRSTSPISTRYKLYEENHHFHLENGKYYRISQVYRDTIDKATKQVLIKELIKDNHSEVLYDYALIPSNEIWTY